MNEADTCRKQVCPKLDAAGWDDLPHIYNEQITFTDGRIVVAGNKIKRRKQKRADFLLRFARDITLGVVEAKSCERPAADGYEYAPEAKAILHELLEKYAEHGTAQFVLPDGLEVPPLSGHGNVVEIAEKFGGSDRLVEAVHLLQTLLYAA